MLGLIYELLDHYLRLTASAWPANSARYKRERLAGAANALKALKATAAGVGPSLSLGRYAGLYAEPGMAMWKW